MLKLDANDRKKALCTLLREYQPRLQQHIGAKFLGLWSMGGWYLAAFAGERLRVEITFEPRDTHGGVLLWRLGVGSLGPTDEARGESRFFSTIASELGLRGSPFGTLERREGEAAEIYEVRYDLENLLLLYPAMAASPKFPDLLPIFRERSYMHEAEPIHCPDLPSCPDLPCTP